MNLYKSIVTAALKVEARNVTNIDEIDRYVQSLLDRAQTDEVKKWLEKTFRKHLINNHEAVPVTKPDKSYPDYINDAMRSGQKVFSVQGLESLPIIEVIDYLNTLSSINFGYEQALKKAERWHKELAEKDRIEPASFDDETATIFKQYKNGWTWKHLRTKIDYKYEGDLMGHCIGGHNPEKQNAFSLRDVNNEPHVTIEISKSVPKEVRQIKGQANTVPKKYKKHIVDFFNSYDELAIDCKDAINLGILTYRNQIYFYPEIELVGEELEIDENILIMGGLLKTEEEGAQTPDSVYQKNLEIIPTTDTRVFVPVLNFGYFLKQNKLYKLKRKTYDVFHINWYGYDAKINSLIEANFFITEENNDRITMIPFEQYRSDIKIGVVGSSLDENNFLSRLLDNNYIPTEKGIVSFNEASKRQTPISESVNYKEFVDINFKKYLLIIKNDKVFMVKKDSYFRELSKNFTSPVKKLMSVPKTESLLKEAILIDLEDSFNIESVAMGGSSDSWGKYFVKVNQIYYPYELINKALLLKENPLEIEMVGDKVNNIPRDFWTSLQNTKVTIADSKITIPEIRARKLSLIGIKGNIQDIKTNSLDIIGESSEVTTGNIKAEKITIEEFNGNLTGKIHCKEFEVDDAVIEEYEADLYVSETFMADGSTLNFKSINFTKNGTKLFLYISAVNAEKISSKAVPPQIKLNESTFQGYKSSDTAITELFLEIEPIIERLKHTVKQPNEYFIRMDNLAFAFKFHSNKRIKDLESFFGKESQRLWEIQLYSKRAKKVVVYQSFRTEEIQDVFTNLPFMLPLTLKTFQKFCKSLHALVNIKEKTLEDSLFSTQFGKKVLKGIV